MASDAVPTYMSTFSPFNMSCCSWLPCNCWRRKTSLLGEGKGSTIFFCASAHRGGPVMILAEALTSEGESQQTTNWHLPAPQFCQPSPTWSYPSPSIATASEHLAAESLCSPNAPCLEEVVLKESKNNEWVGVSYWVQDVSTGMGCWW